MKTNIIIAITTVLYLLVASGCATAPMPSTGSSEESLQEFVTRIENESKTGKPDWKAADQRMAKYCAVQGLGASTQKTSEQQAEFDRLVGKYWALRVRHGLTFQEAKGLLERKAVQLESFLEEVQK